MASTETANGDGGAADPPPKPIVELRQDRLHPSQSSSYARCVRSSPLRDVAPGLAFFGTVEAGSVPLHTAVHMYRYPGGHAELQEKRAALAANEAWNEHLSEALPCVTEQSSETYVEAGLVEDFNEVLGLKHWIERNDNQGNLSDLTDASAEEGGGSIVELRRYRLKVGYSTKLRDDTLMAFLQMHAHSLGSRLNAEGVHPTTRLVTVLVSELGSANTVYEVWKHGRASGDDANCCGWRAMEQSTRASDGMIEWRMALAELVDSVDTTVLKPLQFSPLK